MDVRIDFLGDAKDAQSAAVSMDKALESIEAIALAVSKALDDIRIDMRQVLEVQTGARTIGASLDSVKVKGTEAAEAVGRVGKGFGRQAAEVVAGSAAASAALRGLEAQAHATQRSLISTAVLGSAGVPPSNMTAAAARGMTYSPRPVGRPDMISGFASAVRPLGPFGSYGRDTPGIFGDGGIPFGQNYDIGGIGGFGLSGGSTRGRFGFGGGGGDDRLGGRFGAFSGGGGGGGGGGFLSRGHGFDGGFLGGILPGGARPGPAAVAGLALGAAPALGTNLLPALIGPLAALPGLAGTGVAALGTLMLAFHGVGRAIAGNADAYKSLNEQQKQFVLEARGLGPIVDKLQSAASSGILPGVTQGLRRAASPAALSTLTTGVGQIGSALGSGAAQLGGLLGGKFFTDMQGDLFKNGAANVRTMSDAFVHLLSAVTSFAHGAQPITDWIVETIDKGSVWLATWARMKDETGAFNGYLTRTKSAWKDLAGLIGGVAHIFGDLAGILGGSGQTAIQGLIDLLNGLHKWLQANKAEMQALAQTLTQVLIQSIRIAAQFVKDLADGLSLIIDLLGKLPAPVQTVVVMASAFGAASLAVINLTKNIPVLGAAMSALAGNPAIVALIAAAAAMKYLGGGQGITDVNGTGDKNMHVVTVGGVRYSAPMGTSAADTLDRFAAGKKMSKTDMKIVNAARGDAALLNDGAAHVGYKIPATAGSGGGKNSLYGSALEDYIRTRASAFGLDPNAVMAVVSVEGGLHGAIGDGGHAFGPFQANNAGGVATGMTASRATAYFQSTQGIDYMLRMHASVAKGLTGQSAIEAMVRRVERPADPTGEVAKALGRYDGSGGVVMTPQTIANGTVPTDPAKTPPGWQLPLALQTAIAKAQALTPRMFADDRSAIGAAIKYTSGAIPGLKGEDLLSAYEELKSLRDMLASIAKKKKAGNPLLATLKGIHIAPSASEASMLSTGRLADDLLSDARGAIHDSTSLGLLGQIPGLESAKKQITYLNAVLTSGLLDAKSMAIVRQRLLGLKQVVQAGMDAVAEAARARSEKYKSVFEDLAQQAIEAFQKETSDVLAHPDKHADILPLTAKLLGLEDAHTQQALQDQLKDAQENLAKALVGASEDSSGVLARARETLGKDVLAHAIDVAQSMILGGSPADMTDRIIADMQAALAAAAGSADQNEVVKAQKDVDEAKYQIMVSGLQKQAAAETDAYQEQRSTLQEHLQRSLGLWEAYFADLGHDSSQALADLNSVLASFGLAPLAGSSLTGGVTGKGQLPPGAAGWDSNLNLGAAWGSYSPGIPADMLAGILFGTPGGINPSTGQPYVGFADGGISFKPMMAAVSEKGPEAHIPLNDPKALAMLRDTFGGGDQQVTVVVSAPDAESWIEGKVTAEVVRNVGVIDRKLGRDADTRRRAGTY